MIVILLVAVVLLLACLVFGPFFLGFVALLGAAVGSIFAASILAILLLCGGLYALGAAAWCIWYLIAPEAALRAYRAAMRDRERGL